jgi:hypothetical protein
LRYIGDAELKPKAAGYPVVRAVPASGHGDVGIPVERGRNEGMPSFGTTPAELNCDVAEEGYSTYLSIFLNLVQVGRRDLEPSEEQNGIDSKDMMR